ncbi:MAG: hypothetical protein JW715_09735 [Sedimentisphaerales bacterium]|nr:hypothetical protein [Sedimentisphaerales bacterium]
MSAESDYIQAEIKSILQTSDMIQDLLRHEVLSKYETIALGKLLQDIYTGIERIIRNKLESQGIKTVKNHSWHKEMLLAAKENAVVSQRQFDEFRKLLVFRHMQIHGYGYMLDEKRLRELAEFVPAVCRDFIQFITGS